MARRAQRVAAEDRTDGVPPPGTRADLGLLARARRGRAVPHVLGLVAVVGAAVVVMLPSLLHGASLGPVDLLSRYGLTRRTGVVVHNSQTTDQIAEMIPWASLAWTQVHQGHLPLWNPYNALGLPLAFNWQSSVFSLPALLGYLAPLRLAYTVQVLVTLVIAGTGVYVFARVLRLCVVACVMAAVVYEIGGAFMGFLGWPIATVMAWAGWMFAASVLVVRGPRRTLAVALLAVAAASAVYAGQPDALVLLVLGLGVFVVVLLVHQARDNGSVRSVLRPLGALSVAAVAGGALAAPLLLPGVQLVSGSVFAHAPQANSALSPYDLVSLMFQGFNGLSLARAQWFSIGSSAYVGVVALVLALAGAALRRRRPEVLALTVVAVVMAALAYLPPAAALFNQLPFRARWHLGLVVLAFAVAVLAGVGTDAVMAAPRDWSTRMWLRSGFGVAGLIIALLWVLGRGHLPPAAAHLRNDSFIWPVTGVALGLVVAAALGDVHLPAWWPGRGRGAAPPRDVGPRVGAVFLAWEAAFLLAVGASVWASSGTILPSTPAVRSLQAAVGSSVVGFGTASCELPPTLGILPETNAGFAVHELSAYDPVTPRAYFRALHVATGIPLSAFCPVVSTAAEARRYGVKFVLVPHGTPGPRATVFDRAVGHEDLYLVPGAAPATLTPVQPHHALPGPDAPGTPVAVTHPDPAAWSLVTRAPGTEVLRLRLTDVPGWHATIDGRPLRMERFSDVMLEALVPAGTHTIELTYWPGTFTTGIALAAVAGAGLIVSVVVARRARRSRPGAAISRDSP
jgi:hypothetical protein